MDNIKYFNKCGWSDVTPYEVAEKINDKTYLAREMQCTLDPNWKPDMIPGGFSAHCTNNNEQKWIIESDPTAPLIKIKLLKKGWKDSCTGNIFKPSDEPRKFYDYNF